MGIRASREEVLRRVWLFTELPESDIARLAAGGRHAVWSRGDTWPAHTQEGVTLLISGSARVVRETWSGQAVTVAELSPGDMFGLSKLLLGSQRASQVQVTSAQALSTTWTRKTIAELLELRPELYCRLTTQYALWLEHARDTIEHMGTLDVLNRVARVLGEKGRESPQGLVGDTQDEIAAIVGASRESVNRAIQNLLRSGKVRRPASGRGLLVPDAGALLGD